jgi:hypothetical protein
MDVVPAAGGVSPTNDGAKTLTRPICRIDNEKGDALLFVGDDWTLRSKSRHYSTTLGAIRGERRIYRQRGFGFIL